MTGQFLEPLVELLTALPFGVGVAALAAAVVVGRPRLEARSTGDRVAFVGSLARHFRPGATGSRDAPSRLVAPPLHR